MTIVLHSCHSGQVNNSQVTCPLKAPFEYFDQIDQSDFHFADLDYRLNDAKGKNLTDKVDAITKEFATVQNACLKKLDEKFPSGAIKIPFEQIGSKDTVTVKSIYISGYSFPWNTATSICYYFTVEYDLANKDFWYPKLPLTFLDEEGDVLLICSIPADKSGKSKLLVKTQPSFMKFTKIIIN